MQDYLRCRKLNNAEIFIYMGDSKSVVVKVIGKFRSLLKTCDYLGLELNHNNCDERYVGSLLMHLMHEIIEVVDMYSNFELHKLFW